MKEKFVLYVFVVGFVWVSMAFGDQKTSFIEGCLKAKGSTQAQCECMYAETKGEIPVKEAAFIIASMSGDMAAIQETAAKLSVEEKQQALATWPAKTDKCL